MDRIGRALSLIVGCFLTLLAMIALSDQLWVAALLFLAGLVFILPGRLGRWAPFRNVRKLRRLGGAGAALLLGLLAVGLTMPMTPERKAAIARRDARDAAAATVSAKSKAASAAREAAGDQAAMERVFVGQYRKLLATVEPCDAQSRAIAGLGESASLVDAYSTAQRAQASCKTAWLTIGEIEPSDDLPEAVQAAMKKATETCSTAYFLRQRGLGTMLTMLDGDARPSQTLAARDDMQSAQGGTMLCVAQWFQAAQLAKIDLKRLG